MLSEFHRHRGKPDGFQYQCKECRNKFFRNYRKENSIALKPKYEKWRESSKPARVLREQRNPRCKIRAKTNSIVSKAVRIGELTKPDSCSECGKMVAGHGLQGHHKDYSMPLEIIWLCVACHCQVHSGALVLG